MDVDFCLGFGGLGAMGLPPLTRLRVDGNDAVEPERSKCGGNFRRTPSARPWDAMDFAEEESLCQESERNGVASALTQSDSFV